MRIAGWVAMLAFVPACVSPDSPVPPNGSAASTEADLPSVFRKTVGLPEALIREDAQPALEAKVFAKDHLPRYPCRKPVVGDYALYSVSRTHRGPTPGGRGVWQTQAYLLLEIITEARENHDTGCLVHVYGAVFRPDGSVLHKEWGLVDYFSPHRYGGNAVWPRSWLPTYDGRSLSIAALDYFHDYDRNADTKDPIGQGAGFRALPGHDAWGRLHRLDYSYRDQDPSGGEEYLVVSDGVPVRGLLFGFQSWSSSSGLRNHEETITLLNRGRMSPSDLEILAKAGNPLPSEERLWESLLWTGPRAPS